MAVLEFVQRRYRAPMERVAERHRRVRARLALTARVAPSERGRRAISNEGSAHCASHSSKAGPTSKRSLMYDGRSLTSNNYDVRRLHWSRGNATERAGDRESNPRMEASSRISCGRLPLKLSAFPLLPSSSLLILNSEFLFYFFLQPLENSLPSNLKHQRLCRFAFLILPSDFLCLPLHQTSNL